MGRSLKFSFRPESKRLIMTLRLYPPPSDVGAAENVRRRSRPARVRKFVLSGTGARRATSANSGTSLALLSSCPQKTRTSLHPACSTWSALSCIICASAPAHAVGSKTTANVCSSTTATAAPCQDREVLSFWNKTSLHRGSLDMGRTATRHRNRRSGEPKRGENRRVDSNKKQR